MRVTDSYLGTANEAPPKTNTMRQAPVTPSLCFVWKWLVGARALACVNSTELFRKHVACVGSTDLFANIGSQFTVASHLQRDDMAWPAGRFAPSPTWRGSRRMQRSFAQSYCCSACSTRCSCRRRCEPHPQTGCAQNKRAVDIIDMAQTYSWCAHPCAA